jgi:hypothetical protein
LTLLLSTPLIPISQRMGSHRGAQGIIYGEMLREDGYDVVANISGPHYLEDFNQFNGLIVYHGNDFTGTTNLFGGLAKFPYVHNFVNFSKFKGPVYSIGIDMPDYGGMIKSLMDRPTNQKEGKIDPRWHDADFENLERMYQTASKISFLPRKKIVGGDSHTICMYRPGWEANAVQYKTLYGALKVGLEQFVEINLPLKDLEEIEFYFGNIDVRHHLCRQPDPIEAARELARRYYIAVREIDFKGPKRVYELLPPENERRSLPKTGYYEGTAFFGSRTLRNECRQAFRDELIHCEKIRGGVEVVLWVDKYLIINKAGELDFKSMEVPHSVHLSRASYPHWQGWEWNHLTDPKATGLQSFL